MNSVFFFYIAMSTFDLSRSEFPSSSSKGDRGGGESGERNIKEKARRMNTGKTSMLGRRSPAVLEGNEVKMGGSSGKQTANTFLSCRFLQAFILGKNSSRAEMAVLFISLSFHFAVPLICISSYTTVPGKPQAEMPVPFISIPFPFARKLLTAFDVGNNGPATEMKSL